MRHPTSNLTITIRHPNRKSYAAATKAKRNNNIDKHYKKYGDIFANLVEIH